MTTPESSGTSAPAEVGPAIAREVVRVRLKEFREASELTAADVIAHTGWSPSKLARIEKGEVTVQPLEVRVLLQFYGVDDEQMVGSLTRLSQASRSRQWYSKHGLAGDFQRFVAYEFEATTINVWQIQFVPALVQTEEYAHAITALAMRRSPDDREVGVRVKLRMDRQEAFQQRLAKPNAPRIVAVLDESILRRPVGGRDTMRRQLDHILTLAEQPEVYTFAVVPLGLEHNSGVGGNFELLQFAPHDHGDVIFFEAAGGTDDLATEKSVTALYRAIMQDLLDYGRTGEDALEMIRAARDSMAV
ncbi:helix-turn-helix domain-containing protein [Dactylosporangium vinaceum]|uniref:Helix-turn-helix domain-containing protein n=1 Tax=Dactylosporangium vinaceum TaxID=53362 RepID=A0ABV5MHU0_9ACTN|nr:helix-turn-helix transcriptional regulator [Dactylosporangium vinaceum]UAB99116.1 helix-turn-helix domain-containing protein [Dactylosporangium vinaceum]